MEALRAPTALFDNRIGVSLCPQNRAAEGGRGGEIFAGRRAQKRNCLRPQELRFFRLATNRQKLRLLATNRQNLRLLASFCDFRRHLQVALRRLGRAGFCRVRDREGGSRNGRHGKLDGHHLGDVEVRVALVEAEALCSPLVRPD